MTTHPRMRGLAHRLLAYEAIAARPSESPEAVTLRVYEKLRQGLIEFAGVASFQSLAFRALTQAKSEAPGLWAVQVAEDGSLQGLGEFEDPTNIDQDRAGGSPTAEEGAILISRLLGLLLLFLGEALTLSLLQVTWPGAALDGRSSENGRKA